MVNMSIADGDRYMLESHFDDLLQRRKQLAPWPFTMEHQITQLYMPPVLFHTIVKLRDRCEPDVWLHRNRNVHVEVPHILKGKLVQVRISCNDYLPVPRSGHLRAVETAPTWPQFHAWTKQAAQIEFTNNAVENTFRQALKQATTYRQLAKALPETMKAIASHNSCKRPAYHLRRATEKYKEVVKELGEDGGSRARSLPPELQRIIQERRKLIETTMAQAVMLPDKNHIGDHPWGDTWINRL